MSEALSLTASTRHPRALSLTVSRCYSRPTMRVTHSSRNYPNILLEHVGIIKPPGYKNSRLGLFLLHPLVEGEAVLLGQNGGGRWKEDEQEKMGRSADELGGRFIFNLLSNNNV